MSRFKSSLQVSSYSGSGRLTMSIAAGRLGGCKKEVWPGGRLALSPRPFNSNCDEYGTVNQDNRLNEQFQ